MARMTFMAGDDYAVKLSRLGMSTGQTAKKALDAAAAIVTDKVRENIKALPEERFRYLRHGDTFEGVTKTGKQDLLDSLGFTPVAVDKKGNTNIKVGFDGYGKFPSKKYPKGLPNQLLARSIESGSSVRKKIPFVRKAVRATKQAALQAMEKVIDEETKKIMEG